MLYVVCYFFIVYCLLCRCCLPGHKNFHCSDDVIWCINITLTLTDTLYILFNLIFLTPSPCKLLLALLLNLNCCTMFNVTRLYVTMLYVVCYFFYLILPVYCVDVACQVIRISLL